MGGPADEYSEHYNYHSNYVTYHPNEQKFLSSHDFYLLALVIASPSLNRYNNNEMYYVCITV